MKKLAEIKGAKVLNKEEQTQIVGGDYPDFDEEGSGGGSRWAMRRLTPNCCVYSNNICFPRC